MCSFKQFAFIFIVLQLCANINALDCIKCDSLDNVDCAIKPDAKFEVEHCNKENDECVTSIVAGLTRRGCLSRLYPTLYCPEPCEHCNTTLCNDQLFPANRLQCYQCSGATCLDMSNTTYSLTLLKPCAIYHENDRCFTNIISASHTLRGCEHTNLPDNCPNVCLKCNYSGCNNETAIHEESCLQCTHTSMAPNANCLRQQQPLVGDQCALNATELCTNKMMMGHRGQCFTYVNEKTGVVNRGCSTAMGFYPTGSLEMCVGDNCNNKCLDISCNHCDSFADVDLGYNCRNGINLKASKCQAGTFSCYSCEQGNHIYRGCSEPFGQNTLQNSLLSLTRDDTAAAACYSCQDRDGCNSMPIRTCYLCNSLNQLDCGALLEGANKLQQHNCSSANELCVATLLSKLGFVYVVRGCQSDVPECTLNDPFCTRCIGSLCNDNPITMLRYKKLVLEWRSKLYAFIDNLPFEKNKGSSFHNASSSLLLSLVLVLVALFKIIYFY